MSKLARKYRYCCALVILLFGAGCNNSEVVTEASEVVEGSRPDRPNILLIVADDLGYTDLGAYGSEIATPNVDALADTGFLFSDFYAAPTCSPSRAMMLSGIDSHLNGLGTMAERMQDWHRGRDGYEGYLNQDVLAISEILADAGYHTYMAGKWHLGLDEETSPSARGFERSYALLEGGASHLDGRAQADPLISGRKLARYSADGQPTHVPDDFYSTRHYTESIIQFIDSNKSSDKPFFAYLAFTAPHFPLQAPETSRDKYAGVYAQGYQPTLEARLEGLKAAGLVDPEVGPYTGDSLIQEWAQLSEEDRRREARRMEIHAAMIDDMDEYIGKLFDYLKSIDEFDNTLVVFLSDNGAEGREINRHIRSLGTWPDRCCDNSLESMGSANSFIWLNPAWGHVVTGPYRMFKGSTAEGGIRVPAIIRLPGSDQGGASVVSEPVTVLDLVPTFLDAADLDLSEIYDGKPYYRPEGQSFIPLLQGEGLDRKSPYFAWELSNHRGLRRGPWKLLWDGAPDTQVSWTLHNLDEDPNELVDLSDAEPEVFAEMIRYWENYVDEKDVWLPE